MDSSPGSAATNVYRLVSEVYAEEAADVAELQSLDARAETLRREILELEREVPDVQRSAATARSVAAERRSAAQRSLISFVDFVEASLVPTCGFAGSRIEAVPEQPPAADGSWTAWTASRFEELATCCRRQGRDGDSNDLLRLLRTTTIPSNASAGLVDRLVPPSAVLGWLLEVLQVVPAVAAQYSSLTLRPKVAAPPVAHPLPPAAKRESAALCSHTKRPRSGTPQIPTTHSSVQGYLSTLGLAVPTRCNPTPRRHPAAVDDGAVGGMAYTPVGVSALINTSTTASSTTAHRHSGAAQPSQHPNPPTATSARQQQHRQPRSSRAWTGASSDLSFGFSSGGL